VIVKLTD